MPTVKQLLPVYAITLVVFLAIDAAWLMGVAVHQFRAALGDLLRAQPDLAAASAFYLIYVAGIVILAIRPAVRERSIGLAGVNGAVLGLTAYATFELTNLAILKGWPVGLALLDIAWGTGLTAVAALAGCWVALRSQPA